MKAIFLLTWFLTSAAFAQTGICAPGRNCSVQTLTSTSTAGPDLTCNAASGNTCLAVTTDGARVRVGATGYFTASGTVITANTQVTATAFNASSPTTNGYQLGGGVSIYTLAGADGAATVVGGRSTDGATAVGVVLTNNPQLANATAKIVSVRSNNGAGEVAYVQSDGKINSSAAIAAATTVTAGTTLGHSSGILNSTGSASFSAGTLPTTQNLWFKDGNQSQMWRYANGGRASGIGAFWAELQSGPHPIWDSFTLSAKIGQEATACPLLIQSNFPDTTGIATTIACTDSAAATLSAGLTTGRSYRLLTTSAAGTALSKIATSNFTESRVSPRYSGWHLAGATITNVRYFAGLVNTDPTTATLTNNAIVWRYDSTVNGNWQLCSNDGTTTSCTDSGVAVVASKETLLVIDLRGAATEARGYVFQEGSTITSVFKTTNLPTTSTVLHPLVYVQETTAAARTLGFNAFAVETR